MTPLDAFEARLEIAQAAPTGEGTAIGRIDTVVGRATVVRTDGSQVSAEQGTPIFQGDTITTALDGKLGIVFVDETRFSIGENGHMVIDSMIYDPGAQTGNSAFKVVEGVFSFISGQIAKTDADAMIIDTPVATIGIRGTHGAGKAAPLGTANTFTLMPEDAGGAIVGEITITTRTGVVTLNQPYQTTQVTTPFLPPPTPLTLPPSVIEKAFGTVVRTLPPSPNQQPGEAGQGGQGPGATPQGPQAPAANARAEVVDRATERAFDQALAQGGSLEQAFVAATQVVIGAAVLGLQSPAAIAGATAPADFAQQLSAIVGNAVTNAIQNPFGTGNVNQGTVGGVGGQGQGFDPFATFGPNALNDPAALGKSISVAIGNAFGGEFKPFGFGVAPPPAVRQAIEAAVVEKVTQQVIAKDTIANFDETISNFTGGNDNLTGSSLNTRFVMTQGASSGGFGGNDTINGGAGTDELALRNLSNFTLVYEAQSGDGGLATYNADGTTGSIDTTSVEQFFASGASEDISGIGSTVTLNAQGNAVRLSFDSSDTGKYGYILAGGTGNDSLSLANGTDLSDEVGSVNGATVSDSTVFGGFIFGGAGDDTITGSAAGDVLFGGDGDDTITPGGATANSTDDKDAVFGGAGNDTIIFSSSSNMGSSGSIQGGAGTGDKLQISETGTATYDFSQWGLSGLETLQVSGTTTVVAGNTFFEGLTAGVTGTGTTTLHVSGTSLNLSGVSLGSNVTSLSAASGSVNGGLTIHDNNSDTVGRTLTGGSGSDTLFGYKGGDTFVGKGGNDTFNLGDDDNASDTVVFATPGTANGLDTVKQFEAGASGDLLNLSAFGLTGDSTPTFQSIATDQTITSGANVFAFSSALVSTNGSGTLSAQASSIASSIGALSSFVGSLSANDTFAFMVHDTQGHSAVWQWDDTGNGSVDSGELTKVATLEGVNIGDLTSANVTG